MCDPLGGTPGCFLPSLIITAPPWLQSHPHPGSFPIHLQPSLGSSPSSPQHYPGGLGCVTPPWVISPSLILAAPHSSDPIPTVDPSPHPQLDPRGLFFYNIIYIYFTTAPRVWIHPRPRSPPFPGAPRKCGCFAEGGRGGDSDNKTPTGIYYLQFIFLIITLFFFFLFTHPSPCPPRSVPQTRAGWRQPWLSPPSPSPSPLRLCSLRLHPALTAAGGGWEPAEPVKFPLSPPSQKKPKTNNPLSCRVAASR